ncbi:hypothetical protein [Rariglobus hedericola]|uniref:Uncharacterized protein n=1 Tax=Rariglobus hedericola TaxID=2597822 RepID=A0A556QJJ8_9BACT|nr:hypothetical protein [Rariglobus hedericola]TSJ76825.1 hypothetical protein FPL22_11940 [Rariglobus hedericola]
MKRPLLPVLFLALGLLALTGCSTFTSRSKEKPVAFNALSTADQSRLENKVINVGDTTDMVYIALGWPDEKQQSTTAAGQTTTWIYNRYWQEYQGEAYGGYRRQVVRDPKTGKSSVYLEPVSRPIYSNRKQPIMRIVFADGKVTQIEQAKS